MSKLLRENQPGTQDNNRKGWSQRLRQDGAQRAAWRISRKIVSPILKMDASFLFDTSLADSVRASCLDGLEVHIYRGLESLTTVQAYIASMGVKCSAEERLGRGEAAVIVSRETQGLGFTWVAFADVFVPEFEMIILVPPLCIYHYDSFVLAQWRGRGIHAAMIKAAKQFAFDQGCKRAVSLIDVLNVSSLRLVERWDRRHDMIIVYLRMRGFKRALRMALGQPLRSRFRKV